MTAKINLTGQRYGRLVVLREGPSRHGRTAWVCLCDCGETFVAVGNSLRAGNTKSCGCLNRDKSHWPVRICEICHGKYIPRAENQKTCRKSTCLRAYHRAWKRENHVRKVYPDRYCQVCDLVFSPGRSTQKLCGTDKCAAQYKRDCMSARAQGEIAEGTQIITCIVCGRETKRNVNALVCSKSCLEARTRELNRERLGNRQCRCIVCGKEFWPPYHGQHYCCSPLCSELAKKRKGRRSYECRRGELLEENSWRYQHDPEYRERKQLSDKLYRQRKNLQQLKKLERELKRRLHDSDSENKQHG